MSAKRTPGPRRRRAAPAVGADRCRQGAHLWAYLDGELSAARERAVAAHLGACGRCRARALRLRAMLEACRTAGCQALPAEVLARARARARRLVRAR